MVDADAADIAAAVRSRQLSALEVTRQRLERIAERDDGIGAVWLVTEERALREARAVDAAVARGEDPGPLAGVPVGWKDIIDTAGGRTTYGSAIFAEHVPLDDADVVVDVAHAGAICVAKLATHELAWGTTTDNPHFGRCVNPRDRTRLPGGSSGGSAAAVAAHLVALAVGTDTAGSVRCPASCCGVVGLKPTFGRVSMAGIRPLAASLDHCGPIARSVFDCALALEVMAGPSVRDPATSPVPVDPYSAAVGRGVAGLTVGVPERFFFEHTSADVAAPVRAAIAALEAAGAAIVEFDLGWPVPDVEIEQYYLAEQAASVAEYWPRRAADLGPDIVADLQRAERLGAVDVALTTRRRREYAARLQERVMRLGVDLIATPTQAFSPPLLGTITVPFARCPAVDVTLAMCALTEVFNVVGWPAITVPCGVDALGLPAGIQLAAAPWQEATCLAAAAVVEAATPARPDGVSS